MDCLEQWTAFKWFTIGLYLGIYEHISPVMNEGQRRNG